MTDFHSWLAQVKVTDTAMGDAIFDMRRDTTLPAAIPNWPVLRDHVIARGGDDAVMRAVSTAWLHYQKWLKAGGG